MKNKSGASREIEVVWVDTRYTYQFAVLVNSDFID